MIMQGSKRAIIPMYVDNLVDATNPTCASEPTVPSQITDAKYSAVALSLHHTSAIDTFRTLACHDQLNTLQGFEYDTMAVACGQAHTCSIQKTFAEDEKVS